MNPPRYTAVAIALHWLVAALIVGGFAVGLYMPDLPLSPQKLKLYSWHKWVGVTAFLLVVVRLAWRAGHRPPAPSPTLPEWQRRTADATHWVLYALMIAVPVTGWLMSSAFGMQTVYFGVLPIPDLLARDKPLAEALREVHKVLNYALLALVAVHLGAALKHHFIDRDDVLARMLPRRHRRTAPASHRRASQESS